jgi:glycosyltransferase involved in cell wall biosynthesis
MKKLSVIVPCYKQEKTIVEDIVSIEAVLRQIRLDYELIIVVDGFLDRTYEVALPLASNHVKVVGYKTNRGKGYAVRYGMARSSGDLVAFIDAGMDLNPNGLSMLLEHMEWYNADIIVGSKRHPVSQVHYPPLRRLYSLVYQVLVFVLFGLRVRDTQVGLKIFRREVLVDIMPRLLVKRFAFDVEMLSVAYHLGYKHIYEAPIHLTHRFESSINRKAIINMLIDTAAIFYRLRLLAYYDDKNARAWSTQPELILTVINNSNIADAALLQVKIEQHENIDLKLAGS